MRPIDSTERTDDFRLRTKQGAVFDREHADDFANIQDAESGSFRLRIKVDDGEGGITHTDTLFQMQKKPLTSGSVTLHKKDETADQNISTSDTNTVLKVTSTYKYPDNHQIIISRFVTYQKANPDTNTVFTLETKHEVRNPNEFTIGEAGFYLVTIQLKNFWNYKGDSIVTNFGPAIEKFITITKPAEQSSSSSAGSTSPAAFDLEPVPDVDPVSTGAEII